jgi:hypothetical protein
MDGPEGTQAALAHQEAQATWAKCTLCSYSLGDSVLAVLLYQRSYRKSKRSYLEANGMKNK